MKATLLTLLKTTNFWRRAKIAALIALAILAIYFITYIRIPVGSCGEESVLRTRFGLYACAGWSDESQDNGCRKIAGIKGYFLVKTLTEEICDGILHKK